MPQRCAKRQEKPHLIIERPHRRYARKIEYVVQIQHRYRHVKIVREISAQTFRIRHVGNEQARNANEGKLALDIVERALQFERDGGVIVECRNGSVREARILGSSFVAPYLTIVLLKPIARWRTRAVVILPDAVAPELFRQLRVWLKWGMGRGVAPEASAGWAGRV